MKKIMAFLLVISLILAFYIGTEVFKPLKKVFPQTHEVFGVKIYATKDVPIEKINHAKAILAEYLDNDEDGQVDNPLVADQLAKHHAGIMIAKDSRESIKILILNRRITSTTSKLQELYASEIHINGAKNNIFDGSLEEILHLITHVGYANAYPDILGEKPGTNVANAMDKARGGHFLKVPKSYPGSAWYTYYDITADYGTQITEYIYWALTSLLNGQNFTGREEAIRNEWQLNTKEKVMNQDPDIYSILSNPEYKFPTKLPDGIYNPGI